MKMYGMNDVHLYESQLLNVYNILFVIMYSWSYTYVSRCSRIKKNKSLIKGVPAVLFKNPQMHLPTIN